MSEGCTFVASPFKPSHCKLCFQAKVDHKIPVLKTVTQKPVGEKPVNSPPQTPEPTNSSIETKVPKFQEVKPVETKPVETKPVKTYKYQTNPQPAFTPTPVVQENETKPVKTYKYQTNPQPAYTPPVVQEKPKPKFSISESVEVTENGVTTIETDEEPAPIKKSFKPVGGIKMQGFDPNMLVKAAAERRAKKNLDSGELEATQGTAEEVKEEPTWEPVPTTESTNYRRGPGADILGGGLAAVLQKRKQKEEAHTALSNPDSHASEIVEEVVAETVSTTNNTNYAPVTENITPTETKPDENDDDWS